jgi:hypothetical protein
MVAEQNTTTAALQSVAVTTVTTPEQKPSKPTLDHNVPVASEPPTPKNASIDLHESKTTHPEPNSDTILPTLPPDVTDSNKIQQPPTPPSSPAAVPNQLDTSKPKDSPIADLVDSPESESEIEIEKSATPTLSPPPTEVSSAADASSSVSDQTQKDSAKNQEPVLAAQKPSPQSSNASSTIIQKTPPNTTNTSTKNASQPPKTAADNAVAPPTPTKAKVKNTTSATTQASSAKSTTNTADSASSASNIASNTIANEDGNFHRKFFSSSKHVA